MKEGLGLRELLNKFMLFGLGAISLTKEKAEKLVEELVKRGDISREEAKDFMKELIAKGEEERAGLKSTIKDEVERLRKDIGLATKADFSRLEERLRQLEEKLGAKSDNGEN